MLGFGIEKGFLVHGSCAFRSSTFISITKLDLIFIMFIKTGVWSSSCLSKPRSLKAKPYDNSTTRWHSCCRAVPVAKPHQFSNLISSNSNFLSKDGGKHEFFWLRNREGQWPEEEGAISDSHTHTHIHTFLKQFQIIHTYTFLKHFLIHTYTHICYPFFFPPPHARCLQLRWINIIVTVHIHHQTLKFYQHNQNEPPFSPSPFIHLQHYRCVPLFGHYCRHAPSNPPPPHPSSSRFIFISIGY